MQFASLTVDPAFRIGEVDPRLYGSFVEHLGRCVYEGIHEPGHPEADEHGFRRDVAALTRELGVPIVRYPGGNFVSGYHWEDGIGPVADRPTRIDLAWRTIEPNHVGVDEFQRWAGSVGAETMMAVNLGTRGIDAARNLVEYCNHPSGTYWSDRRRANGAADPYAIKVWCLGNEMDGPWQIGHKTAVEYGRLAAETGKAMRLVDPSIELVACGSSSLAMPTFGSWEATVLAETYEVADYVSMHAYYQERDGDRDSFLASAVDMDAFIDAVVATADHVRAVGRHRKRINISFDEWNVWYQTRFAGEKNLDIEQTPRLIEDVYSVTDAVVVGDLLISLLRHADRVRIGCQAQLVNVIGLIMTEPGGPAWRQSSYHPFALTSRHGRGTVLRLEPTSPVYETAAHGPVPVLDAVAVQGEDSVVLFAVNRDQRQELTLDVDLRALPSLAVAEHVALFDDDPDAVNDATNPDRVTPRRLDPPKADGGRVQAVLPPLSWNMIRLTTAR
ncbi:alpha-N-arabinofuranosidase [Asanoa ferruginea]|uniref:non-reducing end alpha-L-arabinofuranosidase n=1 Tax=Asanoa ferruginea TaxID=53367 RepID=A0A3D9ZUP7_9ACTN|nr:alpha-N-arabinofuranosidase [Asanoa ferruginea]REG00213.1 alpha-N-arabinofuranosidase [Asanoa ferruginea]GIF46088.1 alpha-N-arabinofuranosidase [Asanoa ferruginea]